MFQRTRQGAVDVISGEVPLNHENVEPLSALLEDCLGSGQPMVVLDLADVALIDSAGLELLLDVQDNFEQQGGRLRIASPNAICRDILAVTGVAEHFEIYDEVKTAVGSFLR